MTVEDAFSIFIQALIDEQLYNAHCDDDPSAIFGRALSGVRRAAEKVSRSGEAHSQYDAVRKIETVEGAGGNPDHRPSANMHGFPKMLDDGVITKAKINVPCLEQGKFLIIIDKDRGNLSVEISLIL